MCYNIQDSDILSVLTISQGVWNCFCLCFCSSIHHWSIHHLLFFIFYTTVFVLPSFPPTVYPTRSCSDSEPIRPERDTNRSGLQDEWPSRTETDGRVELLLPHGAPPERRKWGEGQRRRRPSLRSQLSRGRGGHRRYGKSQHPPRRLWNCVESEYFVFTKLQSLELCCKWVNPPNIHTFGMVWLHIEHVLHIALSYCSA